MTAPICIHREHIRPGDRVCAAVSGGADSVGLLLLLYETNHLPRNALGVGLSAVHIHHGLRGVEADADLAFVQALCTRLEVPLHIRHVDTVARIVAAREPPTSRHETTEEAARALRYEAFSSLLAEGHADAILTAHTLDDQAETVLMKLLRGAWTAGLAGIHPMLPAADLPGAIPRKPTTGRVIRPLLHVRRLELEAYLLAQNQPWRTDSSNADPAFTRNRVRHHLLPILREYNPNLDQALANLAELAREDEARWQSELGRILPQLLLPGRPVRGGGRAVSTAEGAATVAIELDRLRSLEPATRRRVLRAAARSLGSRLNFDETNRLLALAGALPAGSIAQQMDVGTRPAAQLHLSAGLRAERSARELRLYRGPATTGSGTSR